MNINFSEDGFLELYSDEHEDGFYESLFTLYTENNSLAIWDNGNRVEIILPDWLADGIRELVKNKIEQENNRGA